MGFSIRELTIVEAQKTMKATLLGKGIRIDVYVKDMEGNAYDIEMQMTKEKELHLRSRYYHSEMDSYHIKAGQKYKDLKKSIVIFVCAFDPFEENRSIYTFETMCSENPEIVLEDKRKTFFVNIFGDRTGVNEKAVNLLDYFKTGEPTDEYTGGLQKRVQEIRADSEWRTNYMTIEMKMDERFEDGKKRGKAEAILELLEDCGSISKELRARIMDETNPDNLKKWLKLATKVNSIEEFVRQM
ncbi:MAG: Rpn family recombination-promoting nuclease/putative transposase [Lachnospiraceae bacterium]|nr:Rpn family recombination-promoting nuclease/putative transposase [Lachnospiraceae bacterium]